MKVTIQDAGYTLLEILLVLSIISLSLVMLTPNFYPFYYHMKTQWITSQIINELYLARSLAITKQQIIRYSPHNHEGKWEGDRCIKDKYGYLLSSFQSLPPRYHLSLRNSLEQNNAIIYTPFGFTLSQRGSFYLEAPDCQTRIIILVTGRIRIEKSRNIDRFKKIIQHAS